MNPLRTWSILFVAVLTQYVGSAYAASVAGGVELARQSSGAGVPFMPLDNLFYDCDIMGVTGLLFNISVISSDFNLTGTTFRNCHAGALALTSSNITVNAAATLVGVRFINCSNGASASSSSSSSSSYGGALQIFGSVTVRLIDCIFVGNTAPMGAAVYSTTGAERGEGSLSLSGCTFSGNVGQGTVFVDGGVLLGVASTVFSGNSGGSAMYLNKPRVNAGVELLTHLWNVTFIRNVANNSGLTVDPNGDLGRTGGALYVISPTSSINITACTFIQNYASRQGGAIGVTRADRPVTLMGGTYAGNTAGMYGGAVYAASGSLVLAIGTVFANNTAPQGGAVSVSMTAELQVSSCAFSANNGTKFGGGISATTSSALTVANSAFLGNSAAFAGGIECWSCTKMDVTGSTFVKNAAKSAGAVALLGVTSKATLQSNVFINNTAQFGVNIDTLACFRDSLGVGGAICASIQSSMEVRNNTFAGNLATTGGAMYVSRECDVLVDDEACESATVQVYEDNLLQYNAAIGGAGGAVYALNISALTVSCISAANGVPTTTSWSGLELPKWPYSTTGCPGTWSGNVALYGGYGDGLASGMVGMRLSEDSPAVVTDFSSNEEVPIVLEMYDSFGSMMSRGSYESTNTLVAVDITSAGNLSSYVSGGFGTVAMLGVANFSSLKLRAPPGDYILPFVALPTGYTAESQGSYMMPTVTVQVRGCNLGEVNDATGDLCLLCTGPGAFSFNARNATCDSCPDDALCLHFLNETISNTEDSSDVTLTTVSANASGGYLVPMDGYWHSSPFSPQMHECPVTEACIFSGRVELLGSWQGAMLHGEDAVLPPDNTSVIANITPYWNMQCATGYTGPLCAQCDAPTYGWRPSGSCVRCPSRSLNSLYYCLSYLVTVLLLILTIRTTLSRSHSLGEARAEVRASRAASMVHIHGSVSTLAGGGGGGEAGGGGGGNGGGPWYANAVAGGAVAERSVRGGVARSGNSVQGGGIGRRSTDVDSRAGSVRGGMSARNSVDPVGGGRGGSSRGSLDASARGGGSVRGGRFSLDSARSAGGGSRRGGSGVLELAAAAAMAQLEAEGRSGGGAADGEHDATGGDDDNVTGVIYGMAVREGSFAPLPPAVLPGGGGGMRSRVPRSVRARESRLAAKSRLSVATSDGGASALVGSGGDSGVSGGGGGSDGSDGLSRGVSSEVLDASGELGEGGRGFTPRHRLSRASGPFAGPISEGLLDGRKAAAGLGDSWDSGADGNGGIQAARGGSSSEGAWNSPAGMRRRRAGPGEGDADGDSQGGGTLAPHGGGGAGKRDGGGGGWRRVEDFGRQRGSDESGDDSTDDGDDSGASGRGSGGEEGDGGGGRHRRRWRRGGAAGMMLAFMTVRRRRGLGERLQDDEKSREEKPPHTVVIKILVNYLQVTSVARSLNLEYPDFVQRLLNIGSLASTAVPAFVSIDCSLPRNSLPVAVQRILITVCMPMIFTALALPAWTITYLIKTRALRKTAPEEAATGKPAGHGDANGRPQRLGSASQPTPQKQQQQQQEQPERDAELGIAGPAAPSSGGGAAAGEQPAGHKGLEAGQEAAARSSVNWDVALALSAGGAGGGESEGGGPGSLALRPYLGVRMVVTAIAVVFYFYPSVTDTILSVLQCKALDTPDGSDGRYAQYTRAQGTYWELDYSMHCLRSTPHLLLAAVVGFPGVVLWCVGVPLASYLLLRRAALKGQLNNQLFSDRYGFLYEDYRRSYYFWESVIMVRKLAVVGLLLATRSRDDVVQVLVVLGVVVIAGAAQMLCRPYEQARFNSLERTSLAATASILYLAAFFLVGNLSDTSRQILSVLIAFINFAMLTWFVICLAWEAWEYALSVLDVDEDGHVTPLEVQEWLRTHLGRPLAGVVGWIAAPRGGHNGGDGHGVHGRKHSTVSAGGAVGQRVSSAVQPPQNARHMEGDVGAAADAEGAPFKPATPPPTASQLPELPLKQLRQQQRPRSADAAAPGTAAAAGGVPVGESISPRVSLATAGADAAAAAAAVSAVSPCTDCGWEAPNGAAERFPVEAPWPVGGVDGAGAWDAAPSGCARLRSGLAAGVGGTGASAGGACHPLGPPGALPGSTFEDGHVVAGGGSEGGGPRKCATLAVP